MDEQVAWLAPLREWAADPSALVCLIDGVRPLLVSPADVSSRTDDELLAFVRELCDARVDE
jgi:hypothetical protein